MPTYRAYARWVLTSGRRIAVTLVGFVLICAGLAMVVLPGPGILAILAGLAVLATEYAWARHVLQRTKDTTSGIWSRFRR
ncbi:MAG: PGPGW domain-containing protein [Candidatus Binatia bacterium]